MTHILLICLSLGILWPPQQALVVEWLTPIDQDLGELTYLQPTTTNFQYKNLTNQPIVIDNVRTTCGCTAPDWSEAPLAPDSVGTIKIVYDAQKLGYFRKKINVFFNAQRRAEKLHIEGYVEK